MTDSTVTPAQLREDAAWFRADVARAACKGCDTCSRYARAAAALDAQADAPQRDAARFRWLCADADPHTGVGPAGRFDLVYREWDGEEDIRAAFDRVMALEASE
jgi:hypothetical protein